jgi:hypothetical protein
MAGQRLDNTIDVGVAAGNRGVDVLRQPRDTARDDGDAADDHRGMPGRFERRHDSAQRSFDGGARTRQPLRPTRAHGCARALSFLQAARACSTSRRRTASAGACSSSGQSDHRSIAASNAASGSSTLSDSRATRAARSWPAIILRSAAGEPNGACVVDMPESYHARRWIDKPGDPSRRHTPLPSPIRGSGRRAQPSLWAVHLSRTSRRRSNGRVAAPSPGGHSACAPVQPAGPGN